MLSMKYVNKIVIGLALCMGLTTACKDDDETGISGGIAVDKEEIAIGAEGGTEKIAVTSSTNWIATSSKPWIAISPANGLGSAECNLEIDSTLENGTRQAEIRFSVEGQEPKIVTVTQMGFYKQIIVKEPEVTIENSAAYDERYFEATITTNVNFAIDKNIEYSFKEDIESMSPEDQEAAADAEASGEKEGWLELPKDEDLKVNLDRKARPRTIKVRFRWNMNIVPFTRVAKIRLVAQNPSEDQLQDNDGNSIDAFYLTVTQKPALKIEDNRAGDSLAVITINQKIQSMFTIESSENMMNWDVVRLWEATDEAIQNNEVPQEAIGRVRSVNFTMINMADGETLPKEIKHLKYLESFTVQSNENASIREVSLGEEICELKYLKHMNIFSYGLITLPENFKNLGETLETLELSGNNFAKLSTLTDVINQTNFPELTVLELTGFRRTDGLTDLQKAEGDIGMWINFSGDLKEKEAFLDLLTWDNLRSLELSYNFIEGILPTDDEVEERLNAKGKNPKYTAADFYDPSTDKSAYLTKLPNDTCAWLNPAAPESSREVTYTYKDNVYKMKGTDVLRVLPHARQFSINLNFLTGPLPKWILFHPFFVEWNPETMVFNQQEKGIDSKGNKVGFNNIDAIKFDYTYYYGNSKPETPCAYPLYYHRYVASDSQN